MKEEGLPASLDAVFSHDARYLRRAFGCAVNRAGLTPFRFHDLRHTFSSRLAMQGAYLRTLMALGAMDVAGDAEPVRTLVSDASVGKLWKDSRKQEP